MAKVIMIQGTMSNVGKSFFVAALCRIFHQDGYRVAPFKSQNMALNSYITRDGLEMGRAQVMQAEAAGIEPTAAMNPVLLKPTTDVGSQVIVNGEVRGNMRAVDYFRYKKQLLPEIMEAYRTLDEAYDIIVIEGAGSPAELNLKKDDIVNMGLAKLLHAPVLLVGDIDRGGIFAQLIGTCALLEEEERALIKGLVVNQFRGDRALFQDGVRILEEKSGVPVVGVVPYTDVDLEDEDSLSGKLYRQERGVIDIAVIRLPHISNFTDFDVFSQYPEVGIRYVGRAEELGVPDFLILPGSKSTIADLQWLRQNGLEAALKQCVAAGLPLFGICGGYQMLGQWISDPEQAEGGGRIRGLELLPQQTIFQTEKTRTRITGTITGAGGVFRQLNGLSFSGYEIHMGRTEFLGGKGSSLGMLEHGQPDGACVGNVYGSYIHGIFDAKEVAEAIVSTLYEQKGLTWNGESIDRQTYKEQQYDRLAQAVRQSVDLKKIYEIVGVEAVCTPNR